MSDTTSQQVITRSGMPRWLEALNIAGSIASITGISLLALRDVAGLPALSYVLGYALGASLFLAAGTCLVLGLRAGGRWVDSRAEGAWRAVYWLTAIPVAVFTAILMIQLILSLVVPVMVLVVAGHYP